MGSSDKARDELHIQQLITDDNSYTLSQSDGNTKSNNNDYNNNLYTREVPDEIPAIGVGTFDPQSGVKHGLKTRHLSMMALAGIIGPGLLVGTGRALANGGPAALLIGFGVIGMIAWSVMQSLGEMTTLYPTGGAFTKLADRFIDPAFGMAVGWNYFIIWFAVLANEYNTTSSILTYWSGDKVPIYGYVLIFWFVFMCFQMLGIEAFGESEFWLALIKLVFLVGFFIFAIIYDAGGIHNQPHALGFQYWHNPGPWADGFRGVANVFVFCSTFYAGVESVAVAATETKNPAIAVPRAVRQVFWRILFIYMGSAFFFGLTVPYNADALTTATSKALTSPMTIAIQNAGWHGGVHLINAFILVTCLSAINSSIYIGSRTVLFLALDKKAPRFLGWTSKRGVPIPAIILTNCCGLISIMNVSTGAAKAYNYIVNLSGVSTFLVWGSISLTHLRFRRAWRLQGRPIEDLPFKSALFPYVPIFGLLANAFLALIQGWSTFSPFSGGDFVDAYILLPVFFILYLGYKFIFKTKLVDLYTVDLDFGQRHDQQQLKQDYAPESLVISDHDVHSSSKLKTRFKKLAQNF